MSEIYINNSGEWHQLSNMYTHYSGEWHAVQNVYVHDSGEWHLSWAPNNNTSVFNTPGVQYYTVPPGVYNLIGAYQTPTGIFTATIAGVQPGEIIAMNIGNYGSSSTVRINATTYVLPAFDTPILSFDGSVDDKLSVEFSVATPTGTPYGAGIGGTVTGLTLVSGGTGYPDYVIGAYATTSTGVGTGLAVNFIASGGIINSVGIWNGGAGYTIGDTIYVQGGTSQAVLTVDTVESGALFSFVGVSNNTHQTNAAAIGDEYNVLAQAFHGDLASTVALTPVPNYVYINPNYSRLVFARRSGRGTISVNQPQINGPQYVGQFDVSDPAANEGQYSFLINLQQILSISFTPTGPTAGEQEHVTITPGSLPAGKVSNPYFAQLFPQGVTLGHYTWSRISGTIPSGISIDTSLGTLSGSPTTAGTYNFTIQVEDSIGGIGTRTYTIIVLAASSGLSITTGSVANPTVGQLYSQTITVSGGTAPYVWGINGTLPNGITINANGVSNTTTIQGTTTQQGTYNFTVFVTDSQGYTTSHDYTMTVAAASITFSPTSFPILSHTTSSAYTISVTVTGGVSPYSITSSWPNGTPTWPDFTENSNPSAGTYIITGTPNSTSNYSLNLIATDSSSPSLTGSIVYTVVVS